MVLVRSRTGVAAINGTYSSGRVSVPSLRRARTALTPLYEFWAQKPAPCHHCRRPISFAQPLGHPGRIILSLTSRNVYLWLEPSRSTLETYLEDNDRHSRGTVTSPLCLAVKLHHRYHLLTRNGNASITQHGCLTVIGW